MRRTLTTGNPSQHGRALGQPAGKQVLGPTSAPPTVSARSRPCPARPPSAPHPAEQGAAKGVTSGAQRGSMVSAHPSPNQREIVKIAHGWIPLLSPAFQCLSASRILHGRMWIPLFMNHVDLIRPARIHLFILPYAFAAGLLLLSHGYRPQALRISDGAPRRYPT